LTRQRARRGASHRRTQAHRHRWESGREPSLDWHLLASPYHSGIQAYVRDVNRVYQSERALHRYDCRPEGFEWIDFHDAETGILSYMRRGGEGDRPVLVICNMTPVPRYSYRIGVPQAGRWLEILNSDASIYGGSGLGNLGGADANSMGWHGRPASLSLTPPPLSCLVLVPEGERG